MAPKSEAIVVFTQFIQDNRVKTFKPAVVLNGCLGRLLALTLLRI